MDEAAKIFLAIALVEAVLIVACILAIKFRERQLQESLTEARRFKREIALMIDRHKLERLSTDELAEEARKRGVFADDSIDGVVTRTGGPKT